MKILFLNHNYENFGTFYRCYYLAKYLARSGHLVDLVCASKRKVDLGIRQKVIASGFRIITLPRLRIHEYHTGHFLRALINSGIVMWKNYDVLHSFAVAQPATAIPTVVAKLFKSKPIIIDWDDAWEEGLSVEHSWMIAKAIAFLEKQVPKLGDVVTVVSDFLKDTALKRSYRRIVKVPNGSNTDEIKPFDRDQAREILGLSLDVPLLVSVGHTYNGSLEIMLKAFAMALQKLPHMRLHIVGKFGERMNRVIQNFTYLSPNLVFTGEVPFDRVKLYLAAADCLLLPMEDSIFEKARFPIRFGDYLASGRPIVSNAVGEVKRILEEEKAGISCNPSDVLAFSEKIVEVMTNPELRRELGIRARITSEHYAWSKLAAQLSQIYEEVAK